MFLDYTDTVELLRKTMAEIIERKSRWYAATDPDMYTDFLKLYLNLSNNVTDWQLLGNGVARDIWARYFAEDTFAANFILSVTTELLQRSFNDEDSKVAFITTFASNIVSLHDERTAIPRESLFLIPKLQTGIDTLSANIWLLPIYIMHTLTVRLPDPKRR